LRIVRKEKEKVEGLERIEGSARRIVTLVTGFIEASKAESGKVEIVHRPISVNRLLQEVARQQEAELERKGLKLELTFDEKLPDILGDETQLDRVLWNLIGNAMKFTRSGGKITVTSTCEDSHVCIAVKDTGIGIPKDEIPLLFSQFRRLKGAEKIEGSGLGLFIVKTIIEAHRGTVQAESDEQGSTFRARIPIRP
jgi:signal transduction histidine kinase